MPYGMQLVRTYGGTNRAKGCCTAISWMGGIREGQKAVIMLKVSDGAKGCKLPLVCWTPFQLHNS
jgi:hypothetical protein